MDALRDHVFAPTAYAAPSDLYNYIALQRRGFNFFGQNEDPKLHNRVANYQKYVLQHLLHPNTLLRISDSELYGNKYSLSEMMTDLNKAIFSADAGKTVNSYRQNLQIMYTNMLIDMIKMDKYSNMSKSMALYNLNAIRRIANSTAGNTATRAHRQHLALLIDKALKD
jgi:hypothetical protein